MATHCQCTGLTLRGIRCKRMIQVGTTHCYQHSTVMAEQVIQPPIQPVVIPVVELPVDPDAHAEMVMYINNGEEDWPTMADIIRHPSFAVYSDQYMFVSAIRSFDNYGLLANVVGQLPPGPSRRIFMFIFELFRLNKHLYAERNLQRLFDVLLEKLLECGPSMEMYRDRLRRDVDPVYREEMRVIEENIRKLASKKKYIEHIFTGSILGPLIAMKIADSYTE